MRTIPKVLIAGSVGTALLAGSAATATADEQAPSSLGGLAMLDEGHVDVLGVAYEDGELELHIHDEENDAEYAPGQTLLVVNPEAETTVPDDPSYEFLGEPGVDDAWILPDQPVDGLLFAGWATEEVGEDVFVDDEVTIELQSAVGLGDFALYGVGPFGDPDVHFHSDGGFSNELVVPADAHGHANWGFIEPGPYLVTVNASGVLDDGQNTVVESGPVHYIFFVRPA